MATASLTGMPLELLVHLIATYLPTKDLGALRLTNKYLEKALFDTFAKEFFTKKQFMLTTPSLQTLVDISRHGVLNKTLKHCIIGLESYKDSWLPVIADEAQKEAFRNGLADQFALINSGRGRDLLAEAFRRLDNLETLGIRDYDAQGRVRDDNRWRSYGAPTVFRETSCILRTGSSELASTVFLLLIRALADADRAVPSIETILRTHSTGLTDLAFFLPSAEAKMDCVLGGLQQLLLTVNLFTSLPAGMTESTTLMESFLFRTRSLKHLRLNAQKDNSDWVSNVLGRLSAISDLLPNLQRLDFGMMSVRPDALVTFISQFNTTLRHVSLWKIDLKHDDGARWRDSEDRYNPWPRLLRDLSMVVQLTGMTIGCLAQRDGNWQNPTHVHFSNGKISRECSGDMEVWLPQLLAELKVSWPQRLEMDSTSSSDEDEDVGNMDEGEDNFSDGDN